MRRVDVVYRSEHFSEEIVLLSPIAHAIELGDSNETYVVEHYGIAAPGKTREFEKQLEFDTFDEAMRYLHALEELDLRTALKDAAREEYEKAHSVVEELEKGHKSYG